MFGREVIKTEGIGPVSWGSFAMAPFAGRVRHGRFDFAGRTWELPRNWPPHAIHGYVLDRPWRVIDETSLAIDLAAPWPFRGSVIQRFALAPDCLHVVLELHAAEPMPASLGWHPWFRRRLADDEPEVELDFSAESMFERDAEGIPTGALVPPSPRPWDDCFSGVWNDPTLRWPGLELTIASSAGFWVVYDEQPDAVCVEPQTAPPDALNLGPTVVEPGSPLVVTMEWRWRRT